MTDKQKLALKELADVMEKHGITIAKEFYGAKGVWVFSGEKSLCMDRSRMSAGCIREALKE